MTSHPGGAEALPGSTVVVTGAAQGIGAEYVRAFRVAGANVVAVDLPGALWDDGTGVAGDVTSEADWARIVEHSLSRFGRLDVLVNNAAVYAEIAGKRPLTDITIEEWDHVLAVNARGTWQGIKAVAPVMTEAGGGAIVNISSVVARTGAPGFLHYVASKAAVEGITKAAARELGPRGIRVNAVAPGLVDNESTRVLNSPGYLTSAAQSRSLARPMTPGDLVGTVTWLASPVARFVTGQTVIVDGGQVFG
ncbi:SDR family NAD(P)-dependent oxidoreductase [Amycolatopsis pithecellobii]|uniref:SDR family oxidoreductase n=1 Tax=Amycolatopsis pithecellobii TaxID=664692 RepID=A0A6N7ZAX1_9PSEU|nr:SDR family oxidoreductase [Amycolatopsis pithecellobii]MTD58911.1 SDR family oxidoreductase [Amycolatopsis pithecellobii]